MSNMKTEVRATSRTASMFVRIMRPLAYGWLKLTRFKVVGEMPPVPKFVVVAHPHTSNWDLPHALSAGLHYGLQINWMGKASIFRWPFGGLMRWCGGIAVDRTKSNNAVDAMVEAFARAERMELVIAPAGTRSDTLQWKSGFYHIANQARVPLVLAFINYKRRMVGIAGVVMPTGDYAADLAEIQRLYGVALAAQG